MLAHIFSGSPDGEKRDTDHRNGFHYPSLAYISGRWVDGLMPFTETYHQEQREYEGEHYDRCQSRMGSNPFGRSTLFGICRHSSGRTAANLKKSRTRAFLITALAPAVALAGCVTPARMHSETQLNDVALGCGLALGELIQDEAEKKLLLLIRDNPSPKQRTCVAQWARRNGLKAVFVTMNFPAG